MKRMVAGLIALILLAGVAGAREWSVAEAGAKGDGVTDCTAAFQKALDDAGAAGGGVVSVPAGDFAIKGNLAIPAGVTLQGTYRVPPTTRGRKAPTPHGSTLLAYAGRGAQTGAPFIRLAGNSAVLAGLIVRYPEWKQSDVPPVPYPPCVLGDGVEDVGVMDCLLLNPYEGIKLVRAARHFVQRVFGYPIWRGLYVDECYDIGRVENCHFWPFGVAYKPDDPYCQWVNVNGVAFEFARTDWHYVLNTFCFGYGVGYKFSESPKGSANGNFVGLGSDSSRRAVLVEATQAPGLQITNGEFVGRWGSKDSVGVEVAPGAKGKVILVNCSFWGPLDRAIWARGAAGSQLTASACTFVEWDNTGVGSPAIAIDGGAAIVQGSTFAGHRTHVTVGETVRSALLSANQAPGGFNVRNAAGKRTQALGNEVSPVEWTAAARAHYRIRVGREGDEPYLDGWHGRERAGDRATTLTTFRWSLPGARLRLPVNAGKAYTIRVAAEMPGAALAPDAGLYLGERRIVALGHAGEIIAEGTLPAPAAGTEEIELTLRCKTWNPSVVQPGNKDDRELGIQLKLIEVAAEGAAPGKVFNANSGEFN